MVSDPGHASRREQVIDCAPFACAAVAEQALLLVNLIAPRQEVYELALIMMLATPALIFVVVVTNFMSSVRGGP